MQVCEVKWIAVPVIWRNVPVEYPLITCVDGKWGVVPALGRTSLESVIVLPVYEVQPEEVSDE